MSDAQQQRALAFESGPVVRSATRSATRATSRSATGWYAWAAPP